MRLCLNLAKQNSLNNLDALINAFEVWVGFFKFKQDQWACKGGGGGACSTMLAKSGILYLFELAPFLNKPPSWLSAPPSIKVHKLNKRLPPRMCPPAPKKVLESLWNHVLLELQWFRLKCFVRLYRVYLAVFSWLYCMNTRIETFIRYIRCFRLELV